ncbi:MAG TPA: TIGR03118 family protein [Terriglobales bacterium]|nr:TIGR03118 family protein [Terriglobales bacterium]
MKHTVSRFMQFIAVIAFTITLSNMAMAQYKLTNLVSNIPGKANHTDTNLINAWGIARGATSPFWVSDNGTGLSTLYDGTGNPQSLIVTIPSATGNGIGFPTGIVINGSGDFVVSDNQLSGAAVFLFATLDGTISGWSPTVNLNNARIGANKSKEGAVYTGLAISSGTTGNFLYAANAGQNRVDVFDGKFKLVNTFTDKNVPETFAPYGIQDINGEVYVTFASTGSVAGGLIDVFSEQGVFIKRLSSDSHLNQPWGLALAPKNFGPFSNALLVSNNLPNGVINAFNGTTGKFLGTLSDSTGKALKIEQIWGLEFGGGSTANGAVNQLFFTAGPANYTNGRFGVIEFAGN